MSISSDMSFWINTLVATKLKDICPMLDLDVIDRKIYEVCLRDLRNYMVYLDRTHLKVEDDSQQDVFTNSFVSIILNEQGMMYQNLQTTHETAEFIDMWVKMWWKKWQERTKIILSDSQIPKNAISGAGGPPTSLTAEEADELLGITIMKLIQFGEICCTQILGEKLVKKAVDDMKGKELKDKLGLISKLQRQAKEISYVHCPLVFIKADENYFKVREWRNDGLAGTKVT